MYGLKILVSSRSKSVSLFMPRQLCLFCLGKRKCLFRFFLLYNDLDFPRVVLGNKQVKHRRSCINSVQNDSCFYKCFPPSSFSVCCPLLCFDLFVFVGVFCSDGDQPQATGFPPGKC